MFKKLFESSKNPGEVSLVVKSALIGFLPIIGIVLKGLGHDIDQETLKQAVEMIGDIVTTFFALMSAIGMFWGFIRRFLPQS